MWRIHNQLETRLRQGMALLVQWASLEIKATIWPKVFFLLLEAVSWKFFMKASEKSYDYMQHSSLLPVARESEVTHSWLTHGISTISAKKCYLRIVPNPPSRVKVNSRFNQCYQFQPCAYGTVQRVVVPDALRSGEECLHVAAVNSEFIDISFVIFWYQSHRMRLCRTTHHYTYRT